MIILFATERLRYECLNLARLQEACGIAKARRIRQRLCELDAAGSLADFNTLPAAKCEVIDSQNGVLLITTLAPSHMVAAPALPIITTDTANTPDWSDIRIIEIISLDE